MRLTLQSELSGFHLEFHSIVVASKGSWKYLIIDYIWFFVTLKYRCNLLVLEVKIDFQSEKRKEKSHVSYENTVSTPIQNTEQRTMCSHDLPSFSEDNYFSSIALALVRRCLVETICCKWNVPNDPNKMLNGTFFTQNICLDLFSVENAYEWRRKNRLIHAALWIHCHRMNTVWIWKRLQSHLIYRYLYTFSFFFFIHMQTTSHKISNLNIWWAFGKKKKRSGKNIYDIQMVQMVWSVTLHTEIGEICVMFLGGGKLSLK